MDLKKALAGDNIVVSGIDDNTVLSPEALKFVADLQRAHAQELNRLLELRVKMQAGYDNGVFPNFLEGRKYDSIHNGNWTVTEAPHDLTKRLVEITGPASSRKMVVNALNSGANVFMADAEDAESPTFSNIVDAQRNLHDAIREQIDFTDEKSGRRYSLNNERATLMFRPRGLHLQEAHMLVDGQPVSASIFDFGLYFFNNVDKLIQNGSGPYFYLPKLQSSLEARLWNSFFNTSQDKLGISGGTIKATVLIETLPAAFEMEEILYELMEHSAGLNCGRWDYIFSYIKTLGNHARFVLPDRSEITMDKGFLAAYVKRLIQICHRRGAYAIGGMAAQIPTKDNPQAQEALKLFYDMRSHKGYFNEVVDRYRDTWVGKTLADKLREARAGHDGTWIAHPGLKDIAMAAFESVLGDKPNQLDNIPDGKVTADDLLRPPAGGNITYEGLYNNIRVAVEYMTSWLQGNGCVPISNLMEDAATAEISRSQVWQWKKHGARLKDGRTVTHDLITETLDRVIAYIQSRLGIDKYRQRGYEQAKDLFTQTIKSERIVPFMTIPAYDQLLKLERMAA